MIHKIITVFIIIGFVTLWIRVSVLEDNMFKFNNATKTLAGGLMELKRRAR